MNELWYNHLLLFLFWRFNLFAVTNHSFFQFAEKFKEQLSSVSLPNKVITTLLGWAQVVPLPSETLSFIAAQRNTIKSVSSTLALPKCFLAQSKLAKNSIDLKNKLTSSKSLSSGEIIEAVKKVFFAFLSSVTSFIKLPQVLHKTKIIDLNKISRSLPNALAKGEALLSLGVSSMKTVDSAWVLKEQLSSTNGRMTPKVKKTLFKLGSNSLGVLSSSLSAAVLLLEWYVNPLAALVVTTLSVGMPLASKIAPFNKLFWESDSKIRDKAYASLPA